MTAPTPDLVRAVWERHGDTLRQRFMANHGPIIWLRVLHGDPPVKVPIPFTLKRQDFGNEYTIDGDGLVVAQGSWPL